MPYAIYILKCSDGTYYTGITNDMDERLKEHRKWSILMRILSTAAL